MSVSVWKRSTQSNDREQNVIEEGRINVSKYISNKGCASDTPQNE